MNLLMQQQDDTIPFTKVRIPSEIDKETESIPFTPISLPEQDRTLLGQAGRLGGQFALGLAEQALLPYEAAVAPLASPEAQMASYRETLFEDLDRLQQQKGMGQWDEQDQKLYESIIEQIKNPELSKPFIKAEDVGLKGIVEKITGADLSPENFLERSVRWMSFVKNPKNVLDIAKSGIKPKELIKNLAPTTKEIGRGLGAATGFELAQGMEFGPLGTMASEIIGDIVGGKAAGGVKALGKFVKQPKEQLAKLAAKSVTKDSLEAQKDIIKDFRKQNIQPDLGTITDNNLTKMIQARLSASGLVGKPLDKFREKLTTEIKDSYKNLADKLGQARYQTLSQAGEAGKELITKIRDQDKLVFDDLYKQFRERVQGTYAKPAVEVNPQNLALSVRQIEKSLIPGAVKSPQQKTVLKVLNDIKKDIYDENRKIKPVTISSLLNTKIALNDLIDYEVQGGQKKLLANLVGEINRLISTVGVKDPQALKLLNNAEKKFAEHAKTFRNDIVNRIITKEDPAILMNQMNSIAGIRSVKKALEKTPAGKQFFADISRLKLDEMVGKKMTDNVSEQIKLGTFSNLLKNPKEKQLVKELLGEKAFNQLENLQKISGKLAQTADKFLNASKSGTTVIDFALIANLLKDLGNLLSGNPWGLVTPAGLVTGNYISRLITNDKFLKRVEDLILATEKNDSSRIRILTQQLTPEISKAIQASTLEQSKRSEE